MGVEQLLMMQKMVLFQMILKLLFINYLFQNKKILDSIPYVQSTIIKGFYQLKTTST